MTPIVQVTAFDSEKLRFVLRRSDLRSRIVRYALNLNEDEEFTIPDVAQAMDVPYSHVHGILSGTGRYKSVGSLLKEPFRVFQHERKYGYICFKATEEARKAAQKYTSLKILA